MIPQHTVANILETARIEEVIADFVNLKRRGSNLLGLCPFHQEKTPSFTVSPSKGIFKCFGCGKSGNAAGFVMEHEHVSYPEALRYLARKYQIEIEEREQTPEEVAELNERERMFNINNFAQQYFSDVLFNTNEGKAIGLSYFKERDFLESTIRKFQLGFSPDYRDMFSNHAIRHGYDIDLLLATGLSTGSAERFYDRFQGRAIFPIHNLTGKVVGFGGRILVQDKSKAKYINSPESVVYDKSKSLYGIYFAKTTISRLDSCLVVEGYTDVISMFQAGIENVVSSSGTSLTVEQIRLIRRYTKNITVLFDSDPAGIKASLRGIDLILEEGMNVRVVLLPEGEDPDTFVRQRRSLDVENYIQENAQDFVSFKTGLLLQDSKSDPILKAGVIKEVIQTISLIPDAIYREVYIKECSRQLEVDERTLVNELNKLLRRKLSERSGTSFAKPEDIAQVQQEKIPAEEKELSGYYQEKELVKILILFGNHILKQNMIDDEGFPVTIEETVAQYIVEDLQSDNIVFESPTHQKILEIFAKAVEQGEVPSDRFFITHPEPDVAMLSIDLIASPYELHDWERKQILVKEEYSSLQKIITGNLLRYKDKIVDKHIMEVVERLKDESDPDNQLVLLAEKKRLDQVRKQINDLLGIVISK